MLIIETKLFIPQTSSVLVPRPHLNKGLDDGLKCKLTLVTAQAGYGKTTLVSEWAANIQMPVAWVSLDAGDREPIRFWRYTLAALGRAVPAFDEQAVARFASGESLIAALINQLHRLTETVVLVWDDFHLVEGFALIKEIDYLLEHLPSNIHIYTISRTLPALSLAKMRTSQWLNELGTDELSFSSLEMMQFLDQNQKRALSPNEIDEIIEQTEGWAAGLRLAVLYLDEKSEPTIGDTDALGTNRNIADYFFEEVFSHLAVDMQNFLLKTSLLERMNAELCQITTGIHQSQAYLQQLEQMNCFLIPLDEQREWYRYHQLFQDFLQAKVKQHGSDPAQAQADHQQVGNWLETHQYWEEALSHYIAGGHITEAIRLLEIQLPELMRTELRTLRHWLDLLPDAALFEHPTMLMSDIFSLFLLGDIERAHKKLQMALHEQSERSASRPDIEMQSLRGGLMMLQVLGLLFARDFEAAIHYSEQYVRSYPNSDAFASLMLSLGTEGDFDIQDSSLLETVEHMQQRENITRRMLHIWSQSQDYYLSTELNLGYGDIMYELNRLDDAHRYWQQAKQMGEMNSNTIITTVCQLKLAQGYAAQGEQVQAEETLTELNERIDRRQYPRVTHFMNVYEAYLRLQWGEVKFASELFKYDHLHVNDKIPTTMLTEYYVYACLLAEEGRHREALVLLQRLTHVARQSGRMSETIRILLRQSIVLYAVEEQAESMEVLEEALASAEANGYLRTVLDEGKRLIELIQTYVESRQKRHRRPKLEVSLPYVRRLLKLHDRMNNKSPDSFAEFDQEVYLTKKETIVLQWLATGMENKEIAAELGVSINTVKTHIYHIYSKLHVHNRMDAIERARALDLLSSSHI